MTEALFLETAQYEGQLQEQGERRLNISGVLRILGVSRSGYLSWKKRLPSDRERRKKALKERIFTKLFEEAEIAKFSQQELREYEDSLKAYRDIKNSIDTAKEEGREEGIAKEKLATAKRLLGMGLTQEQVAQGAGLSIEDIERLI